MILSSAGTLGFWEGSYKKKLFFALEGDPILGKKKSNVTKPKKKPRNHHCRPFSRTKKKLSFSYSKEFNRTNLLFLLIFLLKVVFKPKRGKSLNFQAKIINQNGENPLKEESILHQSSIFSSSSVSLFNFILVLFLFFWLFYIYTNHFIVFLYFYGSNDVNLWWKHSKTHGMPWV